MSLPMPHEQSFHDSVLSAWDLTLTVMRLLFLSRPSAAPRQRKGQAMKRIPKTPVEFDYDLWTTEDGKCMVRVKITGEVTEVDREVMKALRAEEKRIRRALRSNEGTVKDGIAHQPRIFSLSAVSENEMEKSDWLVDPTSDFANIEARLFVESAMEMLSPLEQEIFLSCLLGEMPIRQFAERNGMRKSTAWDMANSIRKKLQEIF